ncbi:hypothetical protein [Poseidonocella sp. HB161398]|uniref:hypothetical protein n=1 Tax=Poseidonocella sp. HB161398 TaxID=2320855 RepID=UPI001109D99E|nr:hypothetical protein [Poseidonocella sp. HB161398]
MPTLSPQDLRRTLIDPGQLPPGAVLVDQLRERTRWSEGMFVTAQHFNRDQSYMIARQGDMGQAIGKGVVSGLEVRPAPGGSSGLAVSPGLGIGGGGESIVLHQEITIQLGDISQQKQLTAAAGLEESLKLVAESRSGIFVLCAVPVEYSSNPVANYATSAAGQRKLEDSVVNEAVLFTLVPFTLNTGGGSPEMRRARAAQRVFFDGKGPDLPPTSLPLAMMELDSNVLVWLDMHLARRDAGAARADAFGLGVVDTARAIAHHRQYDALIGEMIAGSPDMAFAASSRFSVLPAMGRMPTACVAPRLPAPGLAPVLSQNWLPASVPVELVALPEDEIAQLLEESLTLPPLDLGASREALEQTPVTFIVPVPREDWAATPTEIAQAELTLAPAAPLGGRAQSPAALIDALLAQEEDADLIDPTVNAEWLALLSSRQTLWYARRRQFLRTDALAGEAYAYQVALPELPDTPETPEIPETPETPEAPATDEAAAVELSQSVLGQDSAGLSDLLAPWGLDMLHGRIALPETAAEIGTLAMYNRALLHAVAGGSPLAATHILTEAVSRGLDRAAAQQILQIYARSNLAGGLTRVEALLTGGPVEIGIPRFATRTQEVAVAAGLQRALNGGVAMRAPAEALLPAAAAESVQRLLRILERPDEEAAAILARGGGPVLLREPRDPRELGRVLEISRELGLPLSYRSADPAAIETQARRGLVVSTGRMAELLELFSGDRIPAADRVLAHMERMTAALGLAAADARAAAQRSLGQLLGDLQ